MIFWGEMEKEVHEFSSCKEGKADPGEPLGAESCEKASSITARLGRSTWLSVVAFTKIIGDRSDLPKQEKPLGFSLRL